MKILHVVGARPNFMKVAPIMEAFEARRPTLHFPLVQRLVHTGQHYDRRMSELFFEELELPRPDINLDVGSGSHGAQTGLIMERFESVLVEERPDLVLVVGDVNSTLACTIDAKKSGVAVAHVEAGLRSGDAAMPEEINRIVTDAVADLLFTTEPGAQERCLGIPSDRIHFVGNVMIDSLLKHRDRAMLQPILDHLGLRHNGVVQPYAVATLHRPSNVDNGRILGGIGESLALLAGQMPVIFPVHPRTRSRIEGFGLGDIFGPHRGVRLTDPLGYLDFLNLMANSRLVLTDSGGIQEETTILGVPCMTLRNNTERPVTVTEGTNRLVGTDKEEIARAIRAFLQDPPSMRTPRIPTLWDGRAAERIAEVILVWWEKQSLEKPLTSPRDKEK